MLLLLTRWCGVKTRELNLQYRPIAQTTMTALKNSFTKHKMDSQLAILRQPKKLSSVVLTLTPTVVIMQ